MTLSSILKITSGAVFLASYVSAAPAGLYIAFGARVLNPLQNRPGFHTVPPPSASELLGPVPPSTEGDILATDAQLSKRVPPTDFSGNHPDLVKWGIPPTQTGEGEGSRSDGIMPNPVLTEEEIWNYIISHPQETRIWPEGVDMPPVEERVPRPASHKILYHNDPKAFGDRFNLGSAPGPETETKTETEAIEQRDVDTNKNSNLDNKLPTYEELVASAQKNGNTLREEVLRYVITTDTTPVPAPVTAKSDLLPEPEYRANLDSTSNLEPRKDVLTDHALISVDDLHIVTDDEQAAKDIKEIKEADAKEARESHDKKKLSMKHVVGPRGDDDLPHILTDDEQFKKDIKEFNDMFKPSRKYVVGPHPDLLPMPGRPHLGHSEMGPRPFGKEREEMIEETKENEIGSN